MKYKITIAIIILVFYLALQPGCHAPLTDEDRIHSIIEDVQAAATEKDIGTIKEFIADDYHDRKGREIQDIHALLAYYFFRTRNLSVFVKRSEVTVDGERARALVDVLFLNRRQFEKLPDLIPEDLVVYEFDVGFVKRSERWWVIEGTWERMGGH